MTAQINDNSDRSVTLTVKGLIGSKTSPRSIRTLTIPYSAFSRTLQRIQRQGGQILKIDIQSSPFPSPENDRLLAIESEIEQNNQTDLGENNDDDPYSKVKADNLSPSSPLTSSVDCVSYLLSLNLDTEKFISLSSRRNRRKIKTNRRKPLPVCSHSPSYRRRKRKR